jgi:hypothetical protein
MTENLNWEMAAKAVRKIAKANQEIAEARSKIQDLEWAMQEAKWELIHYQTILRDLTNQLKTPNEIE